MPTDRTVSASIEIEAPPEQIFALLADPRRHGEIDGSGMLRDTVHGPERLGAGDRFGMQMRLVLPYRVVNTVVEFEEGRVIAWQHFARHTWRYELAPLADGRTRVTESWDWSRSPVALPMELAGIPARNHQAIRRTLRRLKAVMEEVGP